MRTTLIFLIALTSIVAATAVEASEETARAMADLLEAASPRALVLDTNSHGHPTGILEIGRMAEGNDARDGARRWIERHASVFGIENATAELIDGRMAVTHDRQVIRFEQMVGDRPVLGGEVIAVLDLQGNLRSLINGYIPLDATLRELAELEPVWSREDALGQAMIDGVDLFAMDPRVSAEDVTRLVFVAPLGEGPQLAWEVHPRGAQRHLNYRFYYDALTGDLLHAFNDIRYANQANVFQVSPGREGDAETSVVELPLRDDPDGNLTGYYLKVFNCIDQGETITSRTHEIPICSEVQVAQADEAGDFLYQPDFMAPDDLFAETHMYYHTMQAYLYHQRIGLDTLQTLPLFATVNYRVANGSSESSERLAPYDNAYFYPAGEATGDYGRTYDAIVFGQGTYVDFAYDGDVIYHEFTHAVFQKMASPGYFTYDEYGLRGDPGAINEAMADYFAGSITSDPEIGEYVGPRLGGSSSNIRNMDNDDSCPSSLMGEFHQDSNHFSGALWDIRKAYVEEMGGDQVAFDTAVFNAMNAFTAQITFDRAANLMVNEWKELDTRLIEVAQQAWDHHGVVGCERVIDLGGAEQSEDITSLYGPQMLDLSPWVPGFMQYRVTVEDNGQLATAISLSFTLETYGREGSRWGAPLEPAFAVSPGEPVEVQLRGTLISGNWIDEVEATVSAGTLYEARYEAAEGEALEPGPYYFLPIGVSGLEGWLIGMEASVDYAPVIEEEEPEPVLEPAVEAMEEPEEDMSPDPEADAADQTEDTAISPDEDDPDDGCGCTTGSAPYQGSPLAFLAVLGIGILWARRRLYLS